MFCKVGKEIFLRTVAGESSGELGSRKYRIKLVLKSISNAEQLRQFPNGKLTRASQNHGRRCMLLEPP